MWERKRGAFCSVGGTLRKHNKLITREQFLTVLASGKFETKVLVDFVCLVIAHFPSFWFVDGAFLSYSFVGWTMGSLGFN